MPMATLFFTHPLLYHQYYFCTLHGIQSVNGHGQSCWNLRASEMDLQPANARFRIRAEVYCS